MVEACVCTKKRDFRLLASSYDPETQVRSYFQGVRAQDRECFTSGEVIYRGRANSLLLFWAWTQWRKWSKPVHGRTSDRAIVEADLGFPPPGKVLSG